MRDRRREKRIEWSKARRQFNRVMGRCLNENLAGTHGPATHGCLCARCREVHRGSPEVQP